MCVCVCVCVQLHSKDVFFFSLLQEFEWYQGTVKGNTHCSNYHDREQGMDEAEMYFRENPLGASSCQLHR